ncbi:MAG: hypothetical protein HYW01_05130 [Deltaproteobacteria bacterium]|nr:hypothetical protein [Deltaproteobacteria bacterium]
MRYEIISWGRNDRRDSRNDKRVGQNDSLICHSEPCPEPFGGACTERIEVLRVNSCEGACEESSWFSG